MRCNVCGRELKEGQMFCQCGNTISTPGSNGSYSYDTDVLNVNSPSSNKFLIIGVIAGFLTFAVIAAVLVVSIVGNLNQMTDRSKWENVSKPAYSITMPGNMKETDALQRTGASQMQHLDTYRSGSAIVDVSVYYYPADVKNYIKRPMAIDLVKKELKKHDVEPLEHGELIYVQFPQDSGGAFLGNTQAWTVDAMYITNEGLYEIEIFTPMNKKDKYEEAVFAMLDSFRPKSSNS